MGNVLSDSWEAYRTNRNLVLLFSIPFVIAFFIPLLATFPTYVSSGAIFIRSASIFTDLNFATVAVIIAALFFSLLFMSFAFVAISLVVKSKKTSVAVSKRVLLEIEKYIGKVFVVLVLYTALLLIANVVGYIFGIQALLTSLAGFFGFLFIFYAPSAIVVDNKGILRSMKNSLLLVVKSPLYFIQWLVLITVIISVLDAILIGLTGFYASYILLLIISLIVLPYFVIFQAEAYMRRFALLRH